MYRDKYRNNVNIFGCLKELIVNGLIKKILRNCISSYLKLNISTNLIIKNMENTSIFPS